MIKIYKDNNVNAIFIEDSNGAQFLNSIQATTTDPTSTKLNIFNKVEQTYLVYQEEFTEFTDDNGLPWGSNSIEVINNLNSMFQSTGTSTTDLPIITSTSNLTLVEGDTLNHVLETTYGVGYEWDLSNVPGITTVDGNLRRLIGGSNLTAGTYTIIAKAINYNGETTQNITLTVSNPPFSNSKSIRFNNNDYFDTLATVTNPLYRPSNGSGSSDAWTIALWFKAGTSSNNEQTILMFGGSDQNNEGRIQLWYDGSYNDKHLRLRYGTDNNYLEFKTSNNGINQGVWNHIIVTYDGGTTGQSQGQLNNYYNRFNIFINGVNQTLNTSHNNYGWSGSIGNEYFRLGRNGSSNNYMRNNCFLDEVALWNTNETSNVSSIYNSGIPFDLSTLGNSPVHWWRMGDGDRYPYILDSSGNSHFVMVNMTSANIVNDVP